MLRLLLFAFASIVLTPAATIAAETKCGHLPAAPQQSVSALVDRINGVALTETNWHFPPWEGNFTSPFVDWYARFVVATGTENPPSMDEQRAAATLIRMVQSLPRSTMDAAIWTNVSGTTLNATDKEWLKKTFCLDPITSSWRMGEDTSAPIDVEMRDWVSARARSAGAPLRDTGGFITALTSVATRVTKKSSHPFNVMAALFLHTRFAGMDQGSPRLAFLPYYDQGNVHGVRLKSSSSPTSLYLFTAKADDLIAFRQSLAPWTAGLINIQGAAERWKSVRAAFVPAKVAISPVELLMYGRRGFVPSLDAQGKVPTSFGTTISTTYNQATGVDQSDFQLRDGEATLSTVAGIEGSNAPKRMTIDISPESGPPAFALPSSMMYFLVDDRTGLILADGFRLNP